jgi:hypothetical protein
LWPHPKPVGHDFNKFELSSFEWKLTDIVQIQVC